MKMSYSKSLDVIAEPDVLVCGIGCAGIAAAVSAARAGTSTMAVEKWPFAGGNITACSVNGCCGLADMSTGELIVGGIALELLGRTGAVKLPLQSRQLFTPITSASENDGDKKIAKAHTKIPFAWDMEKFKLESDRMLVEAGVQFLYHTQAIDTAVVGGHIDSVLIASKSGVAAVKPRIVIDCTGDADIAVWAGVPFDMNANPQVGTLEFYAGNVRIPDKQEMQDKCAAVLESAEKEGRLGIYGGPFLSFPAPDVLRFNATRIRVDGTSAADLTASEVRGRSDAWQMFGLWKKHLPEFENAYFLSSGPAVGIRETRRIRGEYTLTLDDILNVRRFDDVVVRGGWYIDRHPAHSPGYHPCIPIKAYDIPYRTLVPQGIDNLIVAGRSHSATTDALASSRVGITAMGMGQAAGTAAALCVQSNTLPFQVDIRRLQEKLLLQGAIFQ
jgi:hypothetical protein